MGVPSLFIASLLATLGVSVRLSDVDNDDKMEATTATTTQMAFDADFFESKCDLAEYTEEGFDQSKYQLSDNEQDDDSKWIQGKQCENAGLDLPATVLTDFQGSRFECAQLCHQKSQTHLGEVVCCMHFSDQKICEMRVGWQSQSDSSWGRALYNPLNWFRRPKAGRLFFTSARTGNASYVPLEEGAEMDSASGSRDQVKSLIRQVNHLSVEGIMDHLLSFYICMRWVPDQEFVKLAEYELNNTWVDEATGPLQIGPAGVNRDQVLKSFLKADITPLRCSSGLNVQDVPGINALISSFQDETSSMSMLYKTVEQVLIDAQWGIFKAVREQGRVNNLNRALFWDSARPDDDSTFVADMRGTASRTGGLPWPMFLRSSARYEHHASQAKNLFMLCFGPRTASFPHKRGTGSHLLADMNMVGCNGFWDKSTIGDHMVRIKKLFAPEMCFTTKLQRELRNQFLDTFIAMNEEFETVMAGTFTKRVHELDPMKNVKVLRLRPDLTDFEEVQDFGEDKPSKKFTRAGGLLARAHAKWVVCKAKQGIDTAAFGVEDNFYRNPRSYDKWLDKVEDETVPECRTLDEKTGCVKCIVAVKDEYGCHIRLNITLDTVFKAAQEQRFPFLTSTYYQMVDKIDPDGVKYEASVPKSAVCLVRKSSLEDQDYLHVNNTDYVVRVNLTEQSLASGVVAVERYNYTIYDRKVALQEWEESGKTKPDDAVDPKDTPVMQHLDRREFFPRSYIFSEDVQGEIAMNQPPHKVDYFVSCPCSATSFQPHQHFETFGSQGMAEYYNGR